MHTKEPVGLNEYFHVVWQICHSKDKNPQQIFQYYILQISVWSF